MRALRFYLLFGFVLALLVAGIVLGFLGRGPWAWTIGLTYIAYDSWLLVAMVVAAFRILRQPKPETGGEASTVTVLVCARDERAVLPACLAALRAQTAPAEEIVVVDDGSRDDSADWLRREYALDAQDASEAWPGLRLLALPHGGKARALNAAFPAARGDLVVTLDADTVIEPGALAAVRAAFAADPGLAAAGGVLTPRCRGGRLGRISIQEEPAPAGRWPAPRGASDAAYKHTLGASNEGEWAKGPRPGGLLLKGFPSALLAPHVSQRIASRPRQLVSPDKGLRFRAGVHRVARALMESLLGATRALPEWRFALGPLFEFYQTFEYLRSFLWRLVWARGSRLLLVSGAFAAFRSSVLRELGGFRPESVVEDYELVYRLHRRSGDLGLGWRTGVIAGARGVTDVPSAVPNFIRQRMRWFFGFLQTLFLNRDMVGRGRYGSVGRYMLPLKVVDALLPIYALLTAAFLIGFLAVGRSWNHWVLAVIAGKIAFDLVCHALSVFLYQRWQGIPGRLWLGSVVATLSEPFGFQLLRHLGAAFGWIAFLRGRVTWTPQRTPVKEPSLSAEGR